MVVRSLLTLLGYRADDKALNKYANALKKVVDFVKIAAVATAALGGAVLKLAGDMEQTEIAFETMLGSAEKADTLIKEITDFAAKTPFELSGLIQSSKQLLAFKFGAEEIIPTMRNLGNIAAGVGRDKLPTLVRALGKIRVKGKATMEELNMLLEAGVPILDQLAANYGVSSEELFKMISRGKVAYGDVNKALADLSTGNGMFANLMEKQSRSFLGIISNIGDFFTNLGIAIGKDILPAAKEMAKYFLNFLETNKDIIKAGLVKFLKGVMYGIAFVIVFIRELIDRMGGLESIGKAVGDVFGFIGGIFMFFIKTVVRIIKFLWPFRYVILAIVAAIKAWTIIQAVINFLLTLNPLGLLIIAIGVLLVLIGLLIMNWEKVKKVLVAGWEKIVSFLKGIWDKIISGLTTAWSGVGNFFGGLWEGIVNGFLTAWKGIVKIMEIAVKVADWLKNLWDDVGSFFSGLWDDIVAGIKSAWEGLLSGLRGLWNDFMAFIQPLIDSISSIFEFFFGGPAPEMAAARGATAGTSSTTTVNSTVNMTVPPGTPEEQAQLVKEQGKKAVERAWESILKEGNVNNPGRGF